MVTRLRRPGVLPAVMLFIIILWALAAVIMLTNTLVDAKHIENRVGVINGEVAPIDNELDSVKLAGEVATTSTDINGSAAPLTGQLDTTNEHVKGIDTSAKTILSSAELINSSAGEINGTVQQINANVGTIGSSLDSIEASAVSINGSVDSINGSFAGTLSEVVSIDDRLVLAHQQIDTLLGQVRTIGANVANVDNVQVPAILANAEQIDGSPLLLNQAAAASLAQQRAAAAGPQAGSLPAPLPVPDGLLPGQDGAGLPVPEISGLLPLGSQQSDAASPNSSETGPSSDTGSILGSLLGGL